MTHNNIDDVAAPYEQSSLESCAKGPKIVESNYNSAPVDRKIKNTLGLGGIGSILSFKNKNINLQKIDR